jgi:hypothetical protein
MCSFEDPADRVSVLQLNSELHQAHLELISAHCATHQLCLRYSPDELARYGRRDVLEKSAQAASALNEFYASIDNKLPQRENLPASPQPTPAQIAQAVEWLSTYLRQEREHYFPASGPINAQQKALMCPYFSPALLDQVRVIELRGARVAVPEFFAQARALGFEPPEITHMDSFTFLDVIAFNQELSERALFHALVHTVQIQALGLRRYAELWVQSFVKSRAHFRVPLEVHAFSLASKFLLSRAESFSVEAQIFRWIDENRY